jgi:ornithine cyclodeaminase
MKILVLNQSQVRQLLPMKECIDVMRMALKSLAGGNAEMPLRQAMWLPDRVGLLGMMPAFLGDLKVMGIKIVSVFPGNSDTEYNSHQGAVMLFDTEYGRSLAIIDATEITTIRTAAVSAVATDLLARKDAGDLAILGVGTQGREHLKAMRLVRKIHRVRVWDLNPDRSRRFAERESKKYSIKVEAMDAPHAAVSGADIICTTSAATEPILFGYWISDGAHINAVGACFKTARELDTQAVARSKLFVDRRESTVNEAGDFILAKEEGEIKDSHILGEVGDILTGNLEGRKTDNEITLFESLGLAVEDIASAEYIYQKALEQDMGTSVELGGKRSSSD